MHDHVEGNFTPGVTCLNSEQGLKTTPAEEGNLMEAMLEMPVAKEPTVPNVTGHMAQVSSHGTNVSLGMGQGTKVCIDREWTSADSHDSNAAVGLSRERRELRLESKGGMGMHWQSIVCNGKGGTSGANLGSSSDLVLTKEHRGRGFSWDYSTTVWYCQTYDYGGKCGQF